MLDTMADETYDRSIRQYERERIAALLNYHADEIETFAAPGQAVRLAAFLIRLDMSDMTETMDDILARART